MKNNFMKGVKRKAYKETNNYIRGMGMLYNLFSNEPCISNDDESVFEYIKEMPMESITEIITEVLKRCLRLDLTECFENPFLFKLMVAQFIQELRSIEETI